MCSLMKYFEEEFVPQMRRQLEKDYERWGDTWRHRPEDGQEMRIKARFNDYFDMFEHASTNVPWLKIAGNAVIAQARIDHPEWLMEESEE
jgi:acyl-ACP thioesterase